MTLSEDSPIVRTQEILEQMLRHRIIPNTITYTAAIKVIRRTLKASDHNHDQAVDVVLKILEKMEDSDHKYAPNKHTYSEVLAVLHADSGCAIRTRLFLY